MIHENREFSEKKGVAFVCCWFFLFFFFLEGGRGTNGSIQTAEVNWKVLRDSFSESLSSFLSAEVNAMVCVAKLHSLM